MKLELLDVSGYVASEERRADIANTLAASSQLLQSYTNAQKRYMLKVIQCCHTGLCRILATLTIYM